MFDNMTIVLDPMLMLILFGAIAIFSSSRIPVSGSHKDTTVYRGDRHAWS